MNYKKRTSKRGTKSKEWYEEQIARIAPTIHYVVDDFEAMKLSYDIYNDDVSALTKEFNKWCDPLDSQLKQYTPVPYPVIHNKVNVLKGEMLKRQDEYSIISFSQKATQQKSKELKESVQRKVEQMMEDFQSKIQQGASEEEIQQMIEAERDRITPEDINLKNFKTEWEIFYEFALRYCLQTQHVKNKKVGEYIIYRRARTYSDVYEEHKSSLTTEELERLEGAASLRINKGHSVIGNKGSQAKYQFDTTETELSMALDGKRNVKSDKTLAEHQTSSTLNYNSYNTLIWETHYEFKGYENIYFLSYTDELGNKVTLPITKSFDIPKDADKYQKENRFGVKTTSFTWVEDEIQYDSIRTR